MDKRRETNGQNEIRKDRVIKDRVTEEHKQIGHYDFLLS